MASACSELLPRPLAYGLDLRPSVSGLGFLRPRPPASGPSPASDLDLRRPRCMSFSGLSGLDLLCTWASGRSGLRPRPPPASTSDVDLRPHLLFTLRNGGFLRPCLTCCAPFPSVPSTSMRSGTMTRRPSFVAESDSPARCVEDASGAPRQMGGRPHRGRGGRIGPRKLWTQVPLSTSWPVGRSPDDAVGPHVGRLCIFLQWARVVFSGRGARGRLCEGDRAASCNNPCKIRIVLMLTMSQAHACHCTWEVARIIGEASGPPATSRWACHDFVGWMVVVRSLESVGAEAHEFMRPVLREASQIDRSGSAARRNACGQRKGVARDGARDCSEPTGRGEQKGCRGLVWRRCPRCGGRWYRRAISNRAW